jgi:hypothetical protein
VCACATRSGWCARLSISAAPISIGEFALNFTLYNKAIAEKDGPAFAQTGQVKEDCWGGHAGAGIREAVERQRGAIGMQDAAPLLANRRHDLDGSDRCTRVVMAAPVRAGCDRR